MKRHCAIEIITSPPYIGPDKAAARGRRQSGGEPPRPERMPPPPNATRRTCDTTVANAFSYTPDRKRSPGRMMTDDSDRLENYILLSEGIPGWTRNEAARELAQLSFSLPAGAHIVEIGSFFGAGTIL